MKKAAGYDLEVRKVYEARPDRKAASESYVRIIDESGEDYLYPSEFFVPVRLPPSYDAGPWGTSHGELAQHSV